ncbi:MAG: DNA polymerase IV [Acidobacteria bacterium]|nr:DNA polymerase IV [Acidobacteriota bacterium]
MNQIRKIIHIDMDAFYAAVEQRDDPALRGRPVCVGGRPDARGVVATCSYEARRFGIHSAMPSRQAAQRCPEAVFVPPRFAVYKEISNQIREIFHEYTDLVEPLSLDEAFLDVTVNKPSIPSATRLAVEIKERIRTRTGLTASAGVSFNKFLAKIASEIHKPDGLTIIPPAKAAEFIDRLPVGKFFGVGRVTEARMQALGIHTGADLKRLEPSRLVQLFGKAGALYYEFAHGRDERPVVPHRPRKSLGKETTLATDIQRRDEILTVLAGLAAQVATALEKTGLTGRTVTLKVKYADFQQVTRSGSAGSPLRTAEDIMAVIPGLLDRTEAGSRKVRLLGITLSGWSLPEEEALRVWQRRLPFMD